MKFGTKLIILSVIISLFLIGSVFAAVPIQISTEETDFQIFYPAKENYVINKNITLSFAVTNQTNQLQTNITTTCYLWINHQDGTPIISKQLINYTDSYFSYTIDASENANKEINNYFIYCNDSYNGGGVASSFILTHSGLNPAGDIFKVFIYLMFMFAVIGILYTLLLGLAKLVTASTTVYDVAISWAFYILLIITYFLAQTYLISVFIENLTSFFLTVTVWTNGVLPVISFIFSVIKKGFDKRSPPSVREIGGKLGYG